MDWWIASWPATGIKLIILLNIIYFWKTFFVHVFVHELWQIINWTFIYHEYSNDIDTVWIEGASFPLIQCIIAWMIRFVSNSRNSVEDRDVDCLKKRLVTLSTWSWKWKWEMLRSFRCGDKLFSEGNVLPITHFNYCLIKSKPIWLPTFHYQSWIFKFRKNYAKRIS